MIWAAIVYFIAGLILYVPAIYMTRKAMAEAGKEWTAVHNFSCVVSILIWPVGLTFGIINMARR